MALHDFTMLPRWMESLTAKIIRFVSRITRILRLITCYFLFTIVHRERELLCPQRRRVGHFKMHPKQSNETRGDLGGGGAELDLVVHIRQPYAAPFVE